MIQEREQIQAEAPGLIFEGIFGMTMPPPNAALRQANGRRLPIDLTRAQSINSKGLEWLEQVAAALPHGCTLCAKVAEGSKVEQILKLMRFDRFILIETQ